MNYKFDGSKVYFTSDSHLNHANITGFCNRPFKDLNEMNETLIANWNRVVGADDIVFIWVIFASEILPNGRRFTKLQVLRGAVSRLYLSVPPFSPLLGLDYDCCSCAAEKVLTKSAYLGVFYFNENSAHASANSLGPNPLLVESGQTS